jgi:ribose/xylose/arabinose/galactoside ABC-type transport system permease subunit
MEQNFYEPQEALPSSTLVLVLGIISIVSCFCYGIPGLVCAIIALVIAKSSTRLYINNPGKYTESSFNNLNAGKICAWIGLIPSIIYIVLVTIIVIIFGWAIISDPAGLINDFHNITHV